MSLLRQVNTDLENFLIVNYTVDPVSIRPLIHDDFELETFEINGERKAIVSAVPFKDRNFRAKGFFSFFRGDFSQTNYRTYIINKKTGLRGVWFFGTSLGSVLVFIPKILWKLPWHFGRFKENETEVLYEMSLNSKFSNNEVLIEKTNCPLSLLPGFKNMEEMLTILTDPLTGYFYQRDHKLGTYSIYHPRMFFTEAKPVKLYFSLFEKLGLLTKEEMSKPHSLFYCKKVHFEIYLPPKQVK